MCLKTRKILYLFFILAFLISAPLVVLYTAGYRYNFGSGKIMQTGVLSLISVPKGADIFIDNEKQRKKTPAVIDNVFPGEHDVRLEKQGYLPWGKKITIEGKKTTFVNQIGLFNDQPANQLIVDEVLKIYSGPDGKFFAYLTAQTSWHELWIFHTANLEKKLIARLPLEIAQEPIIDWSADGTYLSMQTASPSLSLIHAETGKNYDLSNAVPGWWDAKRGDTYYFFQDNRLKFMRLPENQATEIQIDEVAVQGAGDELIIAQKVKNRVVVARTQGETSEIMAYLPLGDYYFQPSPDQNFLLLEDKKRERIYLINTKSREQPIRLNSVAILWAWSPDGQRLLYSDGFDLHIYHLNEHLDETLTRLSQPITGLAWYPPAANVLFCQDDKVIAVDLDSRQGYGLTTLVEGSGLKNLLVEPRGQSMYFFGQINEKKGIFEKKI